MTNTETWPQLAQHWLEQDCVANSGAPDSAIVEFEQKYQVVMPADVRAYFSAMDGQCAEMGSDLFRFWPLSEVKPVSEELSDIHLDRLDFPGCFVLADYLIWSWAYAVKMESGSKGGGAVYCVAGEGHNRQIASSFTEFIKVYLTDPDSIMA